MQQTHPAIRIALAIQFLSKGFRILLIARTFRIPLFFLSDQIPDKRCRTGVWAALCDGLP